MTLLRARADVARRAQIKVCVCEFNRVDKTSRVKRALRASEFKERFEVFNSKLKCVSRCVMRRLASLCRADERPDPPGGCRARSDVVNDLTLSTVTDAAHYAQQAAAGVRAAAEADRRDLAALAEEVRSSAAGLTQTVVAEGGSAVAAAVQKNQAAALETLRELQAQANAQQAQLRALAAQGMADATELSAKLDGIRSAAAAAAAAGAEHAAAVADELASRHAEALASLEFVVTASNNSLSAELRREADKTRAAMAESQKKLADAAEARRCQELAALDAVIKTGSAAAREAATELKAQLEDLKSLQGMELAALRDVARETAALKNLMGTLQHTADDTLLGVKQLLEMMQALKMAPAESKVEMPKQRQEALLKALSACAARLKKAEAAVASLYDQSANDADKQAALKPMHRQVALLGALLASLAEKTKMLPPDQAPRLAADDLVSAVEKSCGSITVHASSAAADATQAPLRYALGAVAEAHADCDAALRGAGADATGDMPVGWPRELWKHAFGRCVWSGTRGALLAAVHSYKGPAIDLALFEPFAAQKQQDFALGGGDRVDALEWRAMASADAAQVEANALVSPAGGGKLCGLAAQLAMDRFLAYAASRVNDDDFRVSVRLCNTAQAQERTRSLVRGMNVAATPACAVARMNDPVLLEVEATHDCFIYVVEQDSSGALCPLLPNAADARAGNAVRANVPRRVPDAALGDAFTVAFCPPAGLERVVCFATRQPWAEYARLAGLADDRQRLTALTRGCVVAATTPAMALAELRFTLLP